MPLRHLQYKYLVAIAFVFGMFMNVLDITIVNVALPVLGRQLQADNDTLQWVVTGYLLSLAVWVPASGWVGDRFGTKRAFLLALGLFTGASALCGLSQNIGMLIGARVVQGVGGGLIMPVGTAMLYRAFPPHERARASGILSIPTTMAPALGPVVGGLLVDQLSWHWIFFINVPIGLAAFLFALVYLREHREEKPGGFDFWGFVLSGASLALLLYALSRGPEAGWNSPAVLLTGGLGLVLLALLTCVELRIPTPMLDLRLFRDRMFRNANLAMFVAMGSLLGVLFLLPFLLQQVRGLTALESGLTTFPQAVGMITFTPLASRLYPRVGPRRMMLAGFFGLGLISALFVLVDLSTDLWWIRLLMFTRGLGMAFTFIPLQVASFSTTRPQDMGRASSLFNCNRQIGSAVGVAILATVLVSRTAAHVAEAVAARGPTARADGAVLAFHDAFAASVAFALLGILFTLFIHDEDAAASMRRGAEPTERPAPAPIPSGSGTPLRVGDG